MTYPIGRFKEVNYLLVVEFEELGLNAKLWWSATLLSGFLTHHIHSGKEVVDRTRQDTDQFVQDATVLVCLKASTHRVCLTAARLHDNRK